MKNYFDIIPVGGCIAKKGKKKTTIVYVKTANQEFRDWATDIIEVTDNGISLYENQYFHPSYSDGYKPCDAELFLKMRMIFKMSWNTLKPLKESLEGTIQKSPTQKG